MMTEAGNGIQHRALLLQSDVNFNQLYPFKIQKLAKTHWTPLHIAQKAAAFLTACDGARILDIGSGAGKFCLAAACYHPNATFHGVEQRKTLINHALKAKEKLALDNVSFIHSNFTELDFSTYTGFYFFNSFYENIDDSLPIDEAITGSEKMYEQYLQELQHKLRAMPTGTKIVTYHAANEAVPWGYYLAHTEEQGNLNFWIKNLD
ncbi:MAG: methyltransferase domain-containing protein [Sphingobacteriales bacterium]|nr:MAG: methyltransferase domain-containing protein [Sphingobacteriales bacterium]